MNNYTADHWIVRIQRRSTGSWLRFVVTGVALTPQEIIGFMRRNFPSFTDVRSTPITTDKMSPPDDYTHVILTRKTS